MSMQLTDGQVGAIRYLNQKTVNVLGLTISNYRKLNENFILNDFHKFVSKALRLGVGPELMLSEIMSIENLLYAEERGDKITLDLIETTAHAVGCSDLINATYHIAHFLEIKKP